MNTEKSLGKLGLSHNEILIYSFLLRKGVCLGNQIYNEMQRDKSSSYRALKSLEQKGLIYSLGETRNQQFGPYPVDNLLKLQQKKEEELVGVRSDLKTFIKDVGKFAKENYKSNNIQVFEGKEGYKLWNEERLYKEGVIVREITTRRAIGVYHDNYYKYMDGYLKRRMTKKIHIRVLFDNSEENDHIDITSKKLLKETRRINSRLALDCILSTFGTKVGFYSQSNGKTLGVIINDSLITNLINSMFDFIWAQAKPVY